MKIILGQRKREVRLRVSEKVVIILFSAVYIDSSLVWLVDGHAGNGAIGLNILTVIHSRFLSRLSHQLRQGIYAYKLKEKFYSNIHG